MIKTKVLILARVLSSYNDPIYQIMNEKVDLTYSWIKKSEVKDPQYKTFQFPYRKMRDYILHKQLRKVINQYDVVIIPPDLRFLKTVLLPFLPHKPKVILWSIGLHVSYKKKYDLKKAPGFSDKLLHLMQNHCDACIFYMPQAIEYWKKYSTIDEQKCFVAHNTVKVAEFDQLPPIEKRDKFLFIGTLYKQKGIGELIEAYAMAKNKTGNMPKLYIVGKGPEKDLVEELIRGKGMMGSIIMTGPIYDEQILKDYFLTSLLCISPKQAGLSVQKSLGYGVPFVTRPDAITGGERFDVIDKKNGFFYETVDGLVDILVNASNNPEEMERLSTNARNYYLANATPEKMAQGALDAIDYVMNK